MKKIIIICLLLGIGATNMQMLAGGGLGAVPCAKFSTDHPKATNKAQNSLNFGTKVSQKKYLKAVKRKKSFLRKVFA